MKILNKQVFYTFIVGSCVGVTALMVCIVFSGHPPFLRAAGVNTGAADVNARYLDGYGTATATGTSKIYVSDGSGYLPDGSIDTGAIINGTLTNEDISDSAAIAASKISTSTLDADLLDGKHYSTFFVRSCVCVSATCSGAGCTATATCSAGYKVAELVARGDSTVYAVCSFDVANNSTIPYAGPALCVESMATMLAMIETTTVYCTENTGSNAASVAALCCAPI